MYFPKRSKKTTQLMLVCGDSHQHRFSLTLSVPVSNPPSCKSQPFPHQTSPSPALWPFLPQWRKTPGTGLASMQARDCCRNLVVGLASYGTSHSTGRRACSPPLPWHSWMGCAALWLSTGTAHTAEQIQVFLSEILCCVLSCFYYKYINKRCWKACGFAAFFEVFLLSISENSRVISDVQGCCCLLSSWPSHLCPIQTCTKKAPAENLWGLDTT